MSMHAENLAIALRVAITAQRKVEREVGYTGDSALVAGWEDALKELNEEKLEIVW